MIHTTFRKALIKKRYTAFFDQVNRTNYQVIAEDKDEAMEKARRLYRKHSEIPPATVHEGWIVETNGADK